jgi:serpin B
MKIPAFLASVALVFATVLNAQGATTVEPSYRWPAELVAGNNRFALDLYHQLSSKPDEPLFFSPYSISTALAMTYAGARGDTAAEMAKTLHFTMPADQLHAAYGSALKQLTAAAPDHGYQFRIANRLWGQQGYTFLDPFLTITHDDYGAELSQLDFVHQTEPARTTINTWVEKQTNDKIKDLIPSGALAADSRLVLTNAIYFKGDWQTPFDKQETQKAPFHLTADKTADVDLMYHQKHFRFARTDDALLIEMPYHSGDISMVVLLPTKVDGLPSLEKSLTAENYATWLTKLRSQNVRVWFPKFNAAQEIQLADKLSAMGMPLAFSPSGADFSGMDGKRDLFISAVIHKAFVDVDEKGTEAAAATGVAVGVMAIARPKLPEEFKADHPFVFLIRDTRSGSILFLGRYTGPK